MPRIRAILEYMNFVILFVLYIMTIEHIDTNHMNGYELAFIVYALAFSLDKAAAMREHGLKVFASSLVNGFDIFFVLIFGVYLAARLIGFWARNEGALEFGEDLLAVGAVFMFPRMVFMTLANNLMILSIRSMLTEFFCKLSCISLQLTNSPHGRRYSVLLRLRVCDGQTSSWYLQGLRYLLVDAQHLFRPGRHRIPTVL